MSIMVRAGSKINMTAKSLKKDLLQVQISDLVKAVLLEESQKARLEFVFGQIFGYFR